MGKLLEPDPEFEPPEFEPPGFDVLSAVAVEVADVAEQPIRLVRVNKVDKQSINVKHC